MKLFELNITDGSLYGENPPGHIRDILATNVAWQKPAPIILKGFNAVHPIKNITFENCSLGGDRITSEKDSVFQINPFVHGIRIE